MIYMAPERITVLNAEDFLEDLLQLLRDGHEIIIDFSKTTYISSACLRSLIIASKTANQKNHPKIECINQSPVVKNILDMVCMEYFIKTHN